jgi:hypothetical protein
LALPPEEQWRIVVKAPIYEGPGNNAVEDRSKPKL